MIRGRAWSLIAALFVTIIFAGDAASQSSGLLLGLRYQIEIDRPVPYYSGDADSLSRDAYVTLYVTRQGRSVQVAERVEGLLIPSGGDFIRAGSKRSVYNNWVEDFVWTSRHGARPDIPGIQPYNGENCEGHRSQRIRFATARYLSLEERTAGYCAGAPHPWFFQTFAVVPIDSTAHTGLDIEHVLGDRARRAFDNQVERLSEIDDEDVFVSHPDPANWAIIRDRGVWRPVVRFSLADHIAVDATEDVMLDVAIPTQIAPRNQRLIPWESIRRVAPGAIDYFVAPGHDLVVILRREHLTVHPLEGSTIGRRLIEVAVPRGAQPVLASWVTGADVDIRRDRLASMRRQRPVIN